MHSITRTLSFTSLILASSLSWAAEPAPAAQPLTAEGKSMHEHQGQQGKRQAHMQERMQERLKAMDSNNDGNISKAEFQAHADKHFQQMDSDGDGQISAQERSQIKHPMRSSKTPAEAVPAPKSPAPSKT
jgi:hypothetical protein